MFTIQIILGSTRPQRQGEKVVAALKEQLGQKEGVTFEFIDLRDWDLPFFQETAPLGALNGKYSSELINKWGETISKADAFIIVTPEYNHGYPAVLKNALDYAYAEWNHKPVAFVGYSGGIGMGIRAIEQLRQVVDELKMVSVRESVLVGKVWDYFDEEGKPKDDYFNAAVEVMFKELMWWTKATKDHRVSA
jgi:NAD(P)H-dependent FMN reductase